jgi:monolysocardiolipin acyltransferase
VHFLCRGFLKLLNKTEVNNLDPFLDLLKSRADFKSRRKGLVTVSNHISVMDDPLIWGVLPLSFTALYGHQNHRWSFGSHDICFKGPFRSHFFTLGQTLPTHRLAHSPFGGLYQSTMIEGVRLLGKINANQKSWVPQYWAFASPDRATSPPSWPGDCVDPFSDLAVAPAYLSAPTDPRYYLSPSRYACNSYSWIHIFPEGMIHQATDHTMRYFKWGVSRLILEPEVCPDVVPMFIEGTDQVMHEAREFPRFLPRIGKKITVTFGSAVDVESRFGDLRRRWRELVEEAEREEHDMHKEGDLRVPAGDSGALLFSEKLRSSPEATELRMECTKRVREEVLKVRRSRRLPDEDPKCGLFETWAKEGTKREGKMEDGSYITEGT